ncbi:histidinol-phosphate transaminase [Candidatus Poribacteria bacterium]|nr:histidinol-phosphate transaminase [Candidatus Poribacteria bacterium]MBT5532493.1 histidinol-phosphate transaminase [Candidatus Poribacteria bacterium]MBT5712517.1 histidinol-phosphate transaminase [Candidatus Poribacteria bacterium]MBT7098828.1 histidinol-phosphate transaminase [Candidatus Poribacteria bacterium]MBT7808343.1 histidinol-phosphate transaminase [Candidatus Poribacteria bacterium]
MLAKPGIQTISAYQGGRPVEEVQRELGLADAIKLASNENPLGPSKHALDAMADAATSVNFYPDGNAFYLRNAVAESHGVEPEQLLFGNGSSEVLQILGQTYIAPGDHIVFPQQSFVVYSLMGAIFDARTTTPPMKADTYDLRAIAAAVTDETKLVLIANPNNPTGTYVTKAQLDAFFDAIPSSPLVVLDEAYFEYVDRHDYPDGLDYVRAGRNVIVTRTFSKAYGLAGLRVGYGVASVDVVEMMNRARPPFNVNALAQAAALAALEDVAHVDRSREVNAAGMDYLTSALSGLGVAYVPSVANFLLVHLARDGRSVTEALTRRGVIVRPMQAYAYPHSVRVTVGTAAQNERFISALGEVLAEIPEAS